MGFSSATYSLKVEIGEYAECMLVSDCETTWGKSSK